MNQAQNTHTLIYYAPYPKADAITWKQKYFPSTTFLVHVNFIRVLFPLVFSSLFLSSLKILAALPLSTRQFIFLLLPLLSLFHLLFLTVSSCLSCPRTNSLYRSLSRSCLIFPIAGRHSPRSTAFFLTILGRVGFYRLSMHSTGKQGDMKKESASTHFIAVYSICPTPIC